MVADLNVQTKKINVLLSKNAITLLRQNNNNIPLQKGKKIAYVSIGAAQENVIAAKIRADYNADVYLFGSKASIGNQVMDDLHKVIPTDKSDSSGADKLIQSLKEKNYDVVIVGLHNYSRRPANNFGISLSYQSIATSQSNHHISIWEPLCHQEFL